jgi:hypothetical protein
MTALAQFESMLPFKISGYYDARISFNKNKKISDITPHIHNSHIVQSFDEIVWEDDFDTVICGYCQEITRISRVDYFQEIISKCKQYNKKLYSFDNPKKYTNDTVGLEYFFPHVDQMMYPSNKSGKLYPVNKPVIGVFGTSSKQGKFTLQLALRHYFLNDDYKVGQISSEPSGYLFGMDFVYPFGYGSAIYLHSLESVAVLNDQIEMMCRKNVDIILAGSQSGTIPYDYNNLNNYLFVQYVFMTAIRPDAVLLCVNAFDDPNYIIRTKNFIESATEGSVIGLVLFPMMISVNGKKKIMCDEEIDSVTKKLSEKVQLPVFVNREADYLKIYEHAISFFSE